MNSYTFSTPPAGYDINLYTGKFVQAAPVAQQPNHTFSHPVSDAASRPIYAPAPVWQQRVIVQPVWQQQRQAASPIAGMENIGQIGFPIDHLSARERWAVRIAGVVIGALIGLGIGHIAGAVRSRGLKRRALPGHLLDCNCALCRDHRGQP